MAGFDDNPNSPIDVPYVYRVNPGKYEVLQKRACGRWNLNEKCRDSVEI